MVDLLIFGGNSTLLETTFSAGGTYDLERDI